MSLDVTTLLFTQWWCWRELSGWYAVAMQTKVSEYHRSADYQNYAIDLSKVYYHRIVADVHRFAPTRGTARKLLDVGCYDGTLSAQFLPRWDVCGLEGDLKGAEKANRKGVKTTVHDLEKPFPFPAAAFDAVIAAEIIEHVYDTDRFLQEIKRVLADDGVLVMSIPNIACFTNRIRMLFGGYPRYAEYKAGGAGHIRVYNLPMPMESCWIPAWIKKIAVKGGDYFPTIAGQAILTARKSQTT
jgi:SAM-dependent methyltransferase